MRMSCFSSRRRQRLSFISLSLFVLLLWFLLSAKKATPVKLNPQELRHKHPLTWKYVHSFNGTGGAWYIPPQWIPATEAEPQTIIDAARLAYRAANATAERNLPSSSIPLIVHQTWKNSRVDTWPGIIVESVEQWLAYSVSTEYGGMAYFLWEDDGVSQLLQEYEPGFVDSFNALPVPVERADVFRILVCNWIGGIYADVDTQPLKPPATWITPSDLEPWTDSVTGTKYDYAHSADVPSTEMLSNEPTISQPVSLMLGIEADCDPETDSYWRMGYFYPVQLTQWALASAPRHPILSQFMDDLSAQIREVSNRHLGGIKDPATTKELRKIDPVSLTGPVAVTLATKTWMSEMIKFRWNALSGLKDDGKSKLVLDVLILPITGFSPGRGSYGNMGSKPVTHPDARLVHHAQGSWKAFNLKVELGKFCRTVFGLCRTWSRVPD